MGSLFAQALVLHTVQIQPGLCSASVLNKSVHGKLASGFEGLAIGKKNSAFSPKFKSLGDTGANF